MAHAQTGQEMKKKRNTTGSLRRRRLECIDFTGSEKNPQSIFFFAIEIFPSSFVFVYVAHTQDRVFVKSLLFVCLIVYRQLSKSNVYSLMFIV